MDKLVFYSGFIFIFLGMVFPVFFKVKDEMKTRLFAVFTIIGLCCFLTVSGKVLMTGEPLNFAIKVQPPVFFLNFSIDALSAVFIFVISAVSILTSIYSIGYLKPYCGQDKHLASHLFFFGILIISMITVTVSANYMMFLVSWELMSLSSFLLVIFENEKEETISAGINYLITMHISLIFLIIGFFILSVFSKSMNFWDFEKVFKNPELKKYSIAAFAFLFTGFGIKAGVFPFHSWLPKAHPAAPSHISAIMSGVMIKTGIYGILRVISFIEVPSKLFAASILALALITALISVLYALSQTDIKKMLAYSSVENIGIILIGVGFGTIGLSYKNSLIAALGFSGALMHLINHSVFKTLLFFGAGTVYQKFHSKNMELLGGLVKFAPYTAALFLIGCLGISGIPAFSGFAGEFVIYLSMIKSVSLHSKFGLIISVLSIAGLALIGAICLFCFIKLYSIVFLGNIRNKKIEESLRKNQNMDPDLSMIIPMFVLSALIILSGLFPNYLIHFISNCVNLLIRSNNSESSLNFNYIIYMASLISYSSLIFITVFIIIILIRRLLLKNRKVVYFKTWDCGYQSGNNRMQYTGSSFIRPFWNIIKMFVKIDYYRITPEGTYPKSLDFKIEVKDFIEEYIIIPLSETVKKILNLFAWMQSGNAQSYILYGIVFIIIILISIMI